MDNAFYFLFPLFSFQIRAEEAVDVESYEVEGSVFQRIADLEQEKVLMQLEKEKAQLQLDLDRLAAEQARLVREQENAEARAQEQQAEIEKQRAALEKEKQRLEDQKRRLAEDGARQNAENESRPAPSTGVGEISENYILKDIVGAGGQLIATLESVATGKTKKISVGKMIDGWKVRSISIDDGIDFVKDGEVSTLTAGTK